MASNRRIDNILGHLSTPPDQNKDGTCIHSQVNKLEKKNCSELSDNMGKESGVNGPRIPKRR